MAGYNRGAIVPSSGAPMVRQDGTITPTWQRFLNALVSQPQGIMAVTLGLSPYDYTAGQSGTLLISGGTVSGVTLTRASVTVTWPAGSPVPMANGDIAEITYSVLPTIKFIPG